MIPQRRPRCWMVGLRADQFDDSHAKDVFQLVESVSVALKGHFNTCFAAEIGPFPSKTSGSKASPSPIEV